MTATTDVYALSLHDALPIYTQMDRIDAARRPGLAAAVGDGHTVSLGLRGSPAGRSIGHRIGGHPGLATVWELDRKSTRLDPRYRCHSYLNYQFHNNSRCNHG